MFRVSSITIAKEKIRIEFRKVSFNQILKLKGEKK